MAEAPQPVSTWFSNIFGAVGGPWQRDHLWLYVLALGFEPESEDHSLLLGADMFDEPNSRAFHVLALFLFAKLDLYCPEETFGDCSFPAAKWTYPEFRKWCYVWLKDIADKHQSCLPQMTPSTLMSPGGPKFVHLFYWFARHVVVEDMKTNSLGTDTPFSEALKLRPKDVHMAKARCRVAYNKLLQIFQKQDFVIQEYEKKAQLLIKEIKQIQSEYAVLEIQPCKMKQNDQTKNDKTERIQKVRSMWTHIIEVLTSLKKEKEVVDSVFGELEDRDDQCILDGTNVVFSVPQLLAHRVESSIHQLCTGNVYEAENLNFLTVIQLLNEALRTLRDERCQPELEQLCVIENGITRCNTVLQNLKAKRLEIEQRCVTMSGSTSGKQEDWEVKWKSFLGLCPLNLIVDQDPELGLLCPLPAHSFNLAEEEDEDSTFCQYLVSVSDVCDSIREVHYEKGDGALKTMMDKSTLPPRRISSVPMEFSKTSENRDVLIEKNSHIETCKGEKPMSPKVLKNGKDESAISELWKRAGGIVIQTESPAKKEDPLKKARDELAEEVAKAVVSESPQSGEGKSMALEDLISSLAFNPFLTRRQIPRTPENLLTEIRTSWRKATQTEGLSDIEVDLTEVMTERAPMDARPVVQKTADSRFTCSISSFPAPDFDPPLSERKSRLSSTEFRPQEQMKISHIVESPVLETSGMRESERTEARELKCIVLNKSSVEDPGEQTSQYVKKSLGTPNICSENDSRTNVLHSNQFWGSVMGEMLHCNVSSLLSSVSCEAGHLGILDETFPEEHGNIDPNKSASSESDFGVIDSAYVKGDSKNKGDIKKSKLDLQSQFNTGKALKKPASSSEEKVHQTCNGDESVSCKSDLSLVPGKRESAESWNCPHLFCLDEEFTNMPLPKSLDERKYSLSSLLVFSQHLEEMASAVHEIPLNLPDRLKDKKQLKEKLGTKEPSSG